MDKQHINYIKHLNGVFEHFLKDSRLNTTHISLYMALFQLWNFNFFKSPFYINREEVMRYAKIGSKSTYHRCIKELNHWNYISYMPSHNPFKGSKIKMFDYGTSSEQVVYPCSVNFETSGGQAVVPFIKHNQTLENLKTEKFSKKNFNQSKNKANRSSQVGHNKDNLRTTEDKNYNQPL